MRRACYIAPMRVIEHVAELRPTQNYVYLAARGLTLFDVAPGRVERDLEQWAGFCRWLDS